MDATKNDTIMGKAYQEALLSARSVRQSDRQPCKDRPCVELVGVDNRDDALVRDVGKDGIGLLVLRPLEPGSVWNLCFQPGRAKPCCTISAKVKHATPQPDGSWHVGFQLSRALADDELAALLGQLSASEAAG
jgi:hypothetical protein